MSAYWRTQFSCNVRGTYAAVQTTENPFSCNWCGRSFKCKQLVRGMNELILEDVILVQCAWNVCSRTNY